MFKTHSIVNFIYTKDDNSKSERTIKLTENFDPKSDYYLKGVDLINGGFKNFLKTGIDDIIELKEVREIMPEWAYDRFIKYGGFPGDVVSHAYDQDTNECVTWRETDLTLGLQVGDNFLRLRSKNGTESDLVLQDGKLLWDGVHIDDLETFVNKIGNWFYHE